MSRLMILCALLACAVNLAFAEQEKSASEHPNEAVSPDWKRAQDGLKKAKPMPQPSRKAASKTATPNGGVVGFDAKTGETTSSAPAESPASNDAQHNADKPDGQSKNAGREKRE